MIWYTYISGRLPHSILFSWYFKILSIDILSYLRIHFYLLFFKDLWDLLVKTCQLEELGPPEPHYLWAVSQWTVNWLWEILCLISVQKTLSDCCVLSHQNHHECYFFARQDKVYQVHTAAFGPVQWGCWLCMTSVWFLLLLRDLSMILCDPFAINTLALSTIRHLQDLVGQDTLPRVSIAACVANMNYSLG